MADGMALVAIGGIAACLGLVALVNVIWPWPFVRDKKSRELMREHR